MARAAAAWRAWVGPTARGEAARPVRVEAPDTLHCLIHWDDVEYSGEDAPRSVMDNLLRAQLRVRKLGEVLKARGTPLPAYRDLVRDTGAEPMAHEFAHWYAERHDGEPDPEVVEVLASEWLVGGLPGTEHVVAPQRIKDMCGPYVDEAIGSGIGELLPEWVRWHGEQADLAPDLLDAAIAEARSGTSAS